MMKRIIHEVSKATTTNKNAVSVDHQPIRKMLAVNESNSSRSAFAHVTNLNHTIKCRNEEEKKTNLS